MHLSLPHLVWSGPPVDDEPTLARLPIDLQNALRDRNGCLAYLGALHIRGACAEPAWHSLANALMGEMAFHNLYPAVHPDDLPFGEDLFGDQFILREDAVLRLEAETGLLTPLAPSLETFLDRVLASLPDLLGYDPLQALAHTGGQLQPGQLLQAYPPFVIDVDPAERSIRPVDAMEVRAYLANFAGQLRDIPDGGSIDIRVME